MIMLPGTKRRAFCLSRSVMSLRVLLTKTKGGFSTGANCAYGHTYLPVDCVGDFPKRVIKAINRV
jgi:hypothetical protein